MDAFEKMERKQVELGQSGWSWGRELGASQAELCRPGQVLRVVLEPVASVSMEACLKCKFSGPSQTSRIGNSGDGAQH